MDAVDEELDNVTRCPGCNTRQGHEILKEKLLKNGQGVDYLPVSYTHLTLPTIYSV